MHPEWARGLRDQCQAARVPFFFKLKHLHERRRTVLIRSNGRPRNHLVEVDGKRYVVPCGNLFSLKISTAEGGEQRRRASSSPAITPRTAVVDR